MEPISSIQIDTEKGWRGGQRQVELLCKGLASRNHPVTLITQPGSVLSEKLSDTGIEVIELKTRFEFDPFAVDKIVSIIRDKSPQIVGMHASHSHTLGVLAKRFIKGNTKFVVTRRVDFRPGRSIINKWKYLKGPDAYIAISTAIKEILLKAKIEKENIHLVHSGVTPLKIPKNSRKNLIKELEVSDDTLLIGDVASLVDHKGHKFLIDAIPDVISKFPNALFLIVGDGRLKGSLKIQAKIRGITDKNLRFLGHRDDVPNILGALDLFVMTSHLEGLCTSIIDAQFAKVAVVATNTGGIPDLITNNATGFLAENKSSPSITQKINMALADSDLREKLANSAARKSQIEFTADAMVESTLVAYQKIIAANPS